MKIKKEGPEPGIEPGTSRISVIIQLFYVSRHSLNSGNGYLQRESYH